MISEPYTPYCNLTESDVSRGIPDLTYITHPFRGVMCVRVPDLPKWATFSTVTTGRTQRRTARFLPVDTGHFLMVENGGLAHG
jgi:hypothetical protein